MNSKTAAVKDDEFYLISGRHIKSIGELESFLYRWESGTMFPSNKPTGDLVRDWANWLNQCLWSEVEGPVDLDDMGYKAPLREFCELVIGDVSAYWGGDAEERIPGLKRLRTLAGYYLNKFMKESIHPPQFRDWICTGCNTEYHIVDHLSVSHCPECGFTGVVTGDSRKQYLTYLAGKEE